MTDDSRGDERSDARQVADAVGGTFLDALKLGWTLVGGVAGAVIGGGVAWRYLGSSYALYGVAGGAVVGVLLVWWLASELD